MSECIIVAVDNSEFTLNEDYKPSRWQSQRDVVTLLVSAKLDSNPETCVGLLSLAGKAPTIVVTPTQVRAVDLDITRDSFHGSCLPTFLLIYLAPKLILSPGLFHIHVDEMAHGAL